MADLPLLQPLVLLGVLQKFQTDESLTWLSRIPTLDPDRWFSNLETRGNTGSASIFIALEEAWRTGRFAPGETILLAVPESGRFSFAFAHLTVVAPPPHPGADR